MNADDSGERAAAILASCSTMTLATNGPDGPWAADVFFASASAGEHFFISSPNSRHARNLLAGANIAATVHPDPGSDWRAIRGLQLEGQAMAVPDAELEYARSVYVEKFPFAAALLRSDSEVASKIAGTTFFVVRVLHLYLVDNRLGFGNRQEIVLSGRGAEET